MKISIHRIEIHNFMAFADEVFDFNAQKGMNLITGKNFDIPNARNGAGKSSVFYALLFGLYGQLPDKIKTQNIANRCVSDKDVRVVVYLDVDRNSYKAITGLNRRAQGYFQLISTNDDGSESDMTKSSVAETRKFFEDQVLHCDMSLFLRTVMLTSEQDYNFFKLKKQDKKDFIEKLFDIGVFGDMYAKIHRDVLDTEKQMISHQNQLLVLNKSKDDAEQRIAAFDENREQQKINIIKQKNECKNELDEVSKSDIKKNNDLIEKYESARSKLIDAKQKVNEQLVVCKSSVQKDISEVKMMSDIKIDKQRALDKHSALVEKLCDDCKEVFLEYHNLTTYRDEIDDAEVKIASKQARLNDEKKKLSSLKEKLDMIQSRLTTATLKIDELNREYDNAKSHQNDLSKKLEMLNFSLVELEKKANPYVEVLDKTNADIEEQLSILDSVSKKSKLLKKAEDIVSHDSLKKFIIKDLIGLINNRIKTYLMKMGSRYTCVFDENLDYEFVTESGPCELGNFSCGEKKRLEIATCLSFRDFISQRSNISANILILDEYIDSNIDSLAVDSILHILKDLSQRNNQNIFIISHRSEVNNELFDRTVELQKKNGISKIAYL